MVLPALLAAAAPQVVAALATQLGAYGLGKLLGSGQSKIQDPYYKPSGQALSGLANYLKGRQGDLNVRGQPGYAEGLKALQDILSPNSTISNNLFSPFLRQFSQQVAPALAAQAYGRGQNRGGSALNSYLTQGMERLGGQGLAQQAALKQFAIPQALGYAQAPANSYLQGLSQLNAARGSLVQKAPDTSLGEFGRTLNSPYNPSGSTVGGDFVQGLQQWLSSSGLNSPSSSAGAGYKPQPPVGGYGDIGWNGGLPAANSIVPRSSYGL